MPSTTGRSQVGFAATGVLFSLVMLVLVFWYGFVGESAFPFPVWTIGASGLTGSLFALYAFYQKNKDAANG